jgi:ABC-type branched-subunit amino acid transport system ATPase component
MLLEVRGLSINYGAHRALCAIDLKIQKGETVAILGANGAGKSTLLKAIAGMLKPVGGTHVVFRGRSILGLPPHQIVEAGVILVPEGRGVFPPLTVAENILLGGFPRRARQAEFETRRDVLQLFPRLSERWNQRVDTMSGGEQQMVAVARALMSRPDLLMLDEPSLGLSPKITGEMFAALEAIRGRGTSILIVEQNVKRTLALADGAYLISNGCIVGEGDACEIASDDVVSAAYLGGASTARQPA